MRARAADLRPAGVGGVFVQWTRMSHRANNERPGAGSTAAVPVRAVPTLRELPRSQRLLLAAGTIAFALTFGAVLLIKFVVHPAGHVPDDLAVYRQAGLIVRHVAPWYDPRRASPLYDWPSNQLPFTYTPFAAIVFTLLTVLPALATVNIATAISLIALVIAVWATFGSLGYRSFARLGATGLVAAVMLWTEPVLQTLSLGQIELVLMALLMWDLCQPEQRWWKGAGVGIAAGIKLVPLIFIPYLLLTRRFRQAGVAAGTFAATILVGYVVLPADSRRFWLDGLFLQGKRTGFTAGVQNQSLDGILTRLAGSMAAGFSIWLPVAIVTGLVGLALAAVLSRAGHEVVGVLTCALTALLVSPISWDHHWVWIAPAVAALAHYAWRASGRIRWTYVGSALGIVVLFAAWPRRVVGHLAVILWGQSSSSGYYGFIYAPPNSASRLTTYWQNGDQSWYPEYHWHGLEIIAGNLYVLVGLAMLVLLAGAAVATTRKAKHRADSRLDNMLRVLRLPARRTAQQVGITRFG